MKKISVVIPVYNEGECFVDFYRKMLSKELKKLEKYDYELILVNDGSRDNSLEFMHQIAEEDTHIRVISFSRNFGKEVALTAGMRQARGDAVLTLDADGQHPVELIPEFIKRWENGADIVIGVRGKYEKHGLVAKMGSKLFYYLLGVMGVKDTVPGSTDFRLIDRAPLDEFNQLSEHGRITRGLMDWIGFKKEYIDFAYGNRISGKPSYNFNKLLHLAIDSFVSLSMAPLMIVMWVGAAITLGSFMLGAFVILEQHILKDPLALEWSSLTQLSIFLTFLSGLTILTQSMSALYISHIHAETQGRPLYIIDKKNSRNLNDK